MSSSARWYICSLIPAAALLGGALRAADKAPTSAAQKKSIPLAIIALLPIRTASRVPATEATPTEAATGSSRTPVPSGL